MRNIESIVFSSLVAITAMLFSECCRAQGLLFEPTETSSFRIGGYAKLDTIFDFDNAGNRFQFDPRTIPIGGENDQQLTIHAKQTRLNLSYNQDTAYGPLDLFVEGDFFGVGDNFRLRHAYGRWDNWLAGQTWSTLVDVASSIETLDIGGADGPINIRRPQLQCTIPIASELTWQGSMEENTAVLTASVPGETRNRIPVFASGLDWATTGAISIGFRGSLKHDLFPSRGATRKLLSGLQACLAESHYRMMTQSSLVFSGATEQTP